MTNMEKTLEALEDVVKVSYSKVVKWTCVGDLCISACYRCTNEGELQLAWYALLSLGDLRMHWMYRRWSLRMASHGSWVYVDVYVFSTPTCFRYPEWKGRVCSEALQWRWLYSWRREPSERCLETGCDRVPSVWEEPKENRWHLCIPLFCLTLKD